MRILITGAGGQVGRELVAAFAATATTRSSPSTTRTLDVADRDAVLGADHRRPGPTSSCTRAAWTAVDACEGDPDRAFAVNALGTRHVAEGARRVGAPVFYVSTDYVFDGTKAEPYLEWDDPNPPSVYGALEAGGRARARPRLDHRPHVVGVRLPRRQHGQDDPAPGRRARHAVASSTTSAATRPSPTTSPR